MKSHDVVNFQSLSAKLETLQKEYANLSKSKPNDPINLFKLNMINQVVGDVADLIGDELLPIKGFTTFNEDSMPTYSDVLMVISGYQNSMEDFRCLNIENHGTYYDWRWKTSDRNQTFKTDPPTRFQKT